MIWQTTIRSFVPAALFCVLAGAYAPMAHAAQWVVQPAASEIVFEYQSDGNPKTGIFSRFEGTGEFDPDDLGTADLRLTIDTSSIDLYDVLASSFAQSAEWFDSKNHPDVIYRLIKLTPIEGDRYEAKGQLTIRGEEKPITSEIELSIGDDAAEAKGSLMIVRLDYLLGVGPSAAFVEIGPEVVVRFDLRAVRAE
ncbi:MAG: YceI family protein [Pseudomonadota bacterium]